MRCSKWLKIVLLFIGVLCIGIQFVPVQRTNPPITGEIKAPAEVMHILRKACYDCHSNETVWPWYSYIAPISWTVESDVKAGRSDLNFSEWSDYSPMKQDFKQAVKWFRKAAEQGDASAQNNLGIMYANGKGVLEDNVTAYAWWNIAAANGSATGKKNKDIIAKRMTADQIAEGQKLSREMLKKNPITKTANKRTRYLLLQRFSSNVQTTLKPPLPSARPHLEQLGIGATKRDSAASQFNMVTARFLQLIPEKRLNLKPSNINIDSRGSIRHQYQLKTGSDRQQNQIARGLGLRPAQKNQQLRKHQQAVTTRQ